MYTKEKQHFAICQIIKVFAGIYMCIASMLVLNELLTAFNVQCSVIT